ncbi:MAG: Lrp/AsnC ligand binding domain-containing protein [Thermoplasmatota archaeon]
MAIGFVLINTAPHREAPVFQSLQDVPEVVDLQPLFGDYDLIAKVEVEDFAALGAVVSRAIRAIPGVTEAQALSGTNHDEPRTGTGFPAFVRA